MISKEKMTVIKVMVTNPIKKRISAKRSNRTSDSSDLIDENDSSALTMNKMLSIAKALSIK
jgi:hypothetical protein